MINPVARLLTALIIAGALVLSVDWVSALTALVGEFVLFTAVGVRLRAALTRGAVVVVAAALTAVTILLYGQTSGTVHWHFFLVTISDGSIALAVATFPSRAGDRAALGHPVHRRRIDRIGRRFGTGAATTRPVRDRCTGRPADGRAARTGLAVPRLCPAGPRRGRSRQDRGGSPGQAFALLVFAVRRGSKLATAMEARGFGAYPQRTWARPSPFGAREFALIASGFVIAAAAIAVSLACGTWNFIGTR